MPSTTENWNRRAVLTVLVAGMAIGLGGLYFTRWLPGPPPENPSKLAVWPIPGVVKDTPHRGVTHWFATDKDGTTVDFFDFDFGTNPKLRWEIADQDQDDATPGDNDVLFWNRSAAVMTRQLNKQGRKPILALWNGAFFGYDKGSEEFDAFHLSPVVLSGKVQYNTSNHRWTFGVKYNGGKPTWKVFFKPSRPVMEKEFDWAAGSVQCLVKEGKPLLLEPYPTPETGFKPQPVPSTPEEAGHIPGFDHMRSARASVGWSKDSRHLYLMYIKETDTEGESLQLLNDIVSRNNAAARKHAEIDSGWMVSDLQKFWLSQGAYTAINSDAGDAGQLAFRRQDGGYTYLSPRSETSKMRLKLDKNLTGASNGGGALMYFFIRETS